MITSAMPAPNGSPGTVEVSLRIRAEFRNHVGRNIRETLSDVIRDVFAAVGPAGVETALGGVRDHFGINAAEKRGCPRRSAGMTWRECFNIPMPAQFAPCFRARLR